MFFTSIVVLPQLCLSVIGLAAVIILVFFTGFVILATFAVTYSEAVLYLEREMGNKEFRMRLRPKIHGSLSHSFRLAGKKVQIPASEVE